MKIFTNIARVIVGLTFIYSGFVKLIDPIGSAIKFEEYFSQGVLNLTFLTPYALSLSVLLILIELLLGVMLLIGFKPKWTVRSAFGLMIVFLFLTLYSAITGKVTDCGCFGDALKIGPWETFYKNVILIALIGVLLFKTDLIKAWFGKNLTQWIPFITLIIGLYTSYYVLAHLPIIDFRPYKIGASISEGINDYSHDEGIALMHDFFLDSPNGDDLTETVLNTDKALLIISYDLSKTNKKVFPKIKKLTDKALQQGYLVYILSASEISQFERLKQEYQLNFDMLSVDATTLKTMIRANPGIMTLEKGTITGKWNGNDVKKLNKNNK